MPDLVAAGRHDPAGDLPDGHRGLHGQDAALLGVACAAGRGQLPHRLVPGSHRGDARVVLDVLGGRVQEGQGGRAHELLHRTDHPGHRGRVGQIGVQITPSDVMPPVGRVARQGNTARVAKRHDPDPAGTGGILRRSQVDMASWATERGRDAQLGSPPSPNALSELGSITNCSQPRMSLSRDLAQPHVADCGRPDWLSHRSAARRIRSGRRPRVASRLVDSSGRGAGWAWEAATMTGWPIPPARVGRTAVAEVVEQPGGGWVVLSPRQPLVTRSRTAQTRPGAAERSPGKRPRHWCAGLPEGAFQQVGVADPLPLLAREP